MGCGIHEDRWSDAGWPRCPLWSQNGSLSVFATDAFGRNISGCKAWLILLIKIYPILHFGSWLLDFFKSKIICLVLYFDVWIIPDFLFLSSKYIWYIWFNEIRRDLASIWYSACEEAWCNNRSRSGRIWSQGNRTARWRWAPMWLSMVPRKNIWFSEMTPRRGNDCQRIMITEFDCMKIRSRIPELNWLDGIQYFQEALWQKWIDQNESDWVASHQCIHDPEEAWMRCLHWLGYRDPGCRPLSKRLDRRWNFRSKNSWRAVNPWLRW